MQWLPIITVFLLFCEGLSLISGGGPCGYGLAWTDIHQMEMSKNLKCAYLVIFICFMRSVVVVVDCIVGVK